MSDERNVVEAFRSFQLVAGYRLHCVNPVHPKPCFGYEEDDRLGREMFVEAFIKQMPEDWKDISYDVASVVTDCLEDLLQTYYPWGLCSEKEWPSVGVEERLAQDFADLCEDAIKCLDIAKQFKTSPGMGREHSQAIQDTPFKILYFREHVR